MSKTKHPETLHYEMLSLLSNQYTEDEAKQIQEEVKKMIEKQDAKITYSDFWGKKKLAYPIKKNYHGYYFVFEFDAPAKNIPNLNKNLSLSDKVLRHLVIRKSKKTPEQIEKEKQNKENKKDNTEESSDEKESSDKKDENLDDKLSGILNANDLVK